MNRLLLLLTGFGGLVATAFLLLFCMALLVTSVTPAFAQVVERGRSTTSSEDKVRAQHQQKSQTKSRNEVRTYTLGDLFFERLAKLEQDGDRQTQAAGGDAGKIDASQAGAWLMSITCPVLSQRTRYVYGQNRGGEYDVGAKDFAVKMEEGPTAPGTANSAWINQAGKNLLGKPIFAHHYVACIETYALLIDQAIKAMATQSRLVDGVLYVPDLRVSADAALMKVIGSYQLTPETAPLLLPIVPLNNKARCTLPTPNGIAGGMTTFTCENWRVSQWPLEAVQNSRVVLSADTINGVKYAFADQSQLASAESATRTKSRTESSKRGEEQKVKVQK